MRNHLSAPRPLLISAALVLAASLSLGSSATASASPTDKLPPAARNNPHISLDVIKSLPGTIQQDPDIYIDPSITPGMPLVYSDTLTPVPGQSPSATAAAADCGSQVAAPGTGLWYGPFRSNCGFIGGPGSTLTYRKYTDSSSNGDACWQGRGYNWLSPTNTYVEYWAGMGCIDGSYTVNWGNVASVPAAKVQSIRIPAGFAGAFKH